MALGLRVTQFKWLPKPHSAVFFPRGNSVVDLFTSIWAKPEFEIGPNFIIEIHNYNIRGDQTYHIIKSGADFFVGYVLTKKDWLGSLVQEICFDGIWNCSGSLSSPSAQRSQIKSLVPLKICIWSSPNLTQNFKAHSPEHLALVVMRTFTRNTSCFEVSDSVMRAHNNLYLGLF